MKLHAKIPALVLPLVIAPLLVLGAFAYSKIHDSMRQRVEADAHRALRVASASCPRRSPPRAATCSCS
ncbi:MAG: hypothetical protein IPG43_05705 [Proteobacteria bacterium]|nr:hypothetical protein [Pseudomonadota bacterium]